MKKQQFYLDSCSLPSLAIWQIRLFVFILALLFQMPSNVIKAQTYEPFECLGVEYPEVDTTIQNMPASCPTNWNDTCIVYIKVGVYFVKSGGNWAYTSTGNNACQFIPACASDPTNYTESLLPSDYSGFDFANDLIKAVNRGLKYNAP